MENWSTANQKQAVQPYSSFIAVEPHTQTVHDWTEDWNLAMSYRTQSGRPLYVTNGPADLPSVLWSEFWEMRSHEDDERLDGIEINLQGWCTQSAIKVPSVIFTHCQPQTPRVLQFAKLFCTSETRISMRHTKCDAKVFTKQKTRSDKYTLGFSPDNYSLRVH